MNGHMNEKCGSRINKEKCYGTEVWGEEQVYKERPASQDTHVHPDACPWLDCDTGRFRGLPVGSGPMTS